MTTGNWIAFGSLSLGTIGLVTTISWRSAGKITERFKSVFRRVDEVKDHVDEKYMKKEVCAEVQKKWDRMYEDLKTTTGEIKNDLKEVLLLIRKSNGA